jgi:DNA-binding GntR family transcriptional regulator
VTKAPSAVTAVKSIPEMVHDHLKTGILSGTFLPGQALKQEEIASQLSVSRAPVREALNQLEREGLVVLRPRRGYVVASLEPGEIKEIFDIRMMLEEYAARIATQRRTAKDIATVRDLVDAMDRVLMDSPENIARWATLNREFHSAIFNASGQRHLCQITSNLRDVVEQYVRLDATVAHAGGQAQKDHHDILAAFEAGDVEGAAVLSRAHCRRTRDRLLASLSNRRAAAPAHTPASPRVAPGRNEEMPHLPVHD